MQLPQRRLFQVSVLDLLLAMAVAVALIITYQSMAPRAFVYTSGFLGGLYGAAIALNRHQPRILVVACCGVLWGIAGALFGAAIIEALRHGVPVRTQWYWQESPRGRVSAMRHAPMLGAIAGVIASGLYTALLLANARLRADANSETREGSVQETQ